MTEVRTAAVGASTTGPTRTVTLLFADIEGSTRLLAELEHAYEEVLAGYHALLRAALAESGGREVGTEGDGFFAVFDTAPGAVRAAAAAQRRIAEAEWPGGAAVRVRMGLHTGEATDGPGGPVGLDVHRAARIAAAAHGGQVLVSDALRGLVEHHLPAGVSLRDLGVHRLKDLAEPQRLHQLCIGGLAADFPPIRSLDAAVHNLPTVLTSFVGRERELTRARELVDTHRLVTLTGPGGTGKTRLALETAACFVGALGDGVWFVALAPIRDPELVPATVMKALGYREIPGREPRDQLFDHLRGRELLLVLDNFEQVLEAATFVSDLLRATADVRVLVTSRAPLHLSGEQEFPVPPLGVPDLERLPSREALADYGAVRLFVERASGVRPDFALTDTNTRAVAELSARLDGLPLAIELAAARVRLLTPEAMLARLEHRLAALGTGPRDLPERQQTLRDTIAWSYDLLGPDDQRLFACLGVFVSGWTLEAAEAVWEGAGDVLDGLATLVDHSLVRRRDVGGDVRFWMLETIREFALERLEARSDGDEVRARHAATFLALAEEAAAHVLGFDQGRWVVRLEQEHPNLRAAMDFFLDRGEVACAARLAVALWRFWQKTSSEEGRRKLDQVIEAAGPAVDDALRSGLHEAAGGLAYWAGATDAAERHYERALEIETALDRPAGIANALYNLVFPAVFGDRARGKERSRRLAEESLARFREIGDRAGAARARWGVGVVAYFGGRYGVAARELRTSLEEATAVGDAFQAHWARHMLGTALLRLGEAEEAKRLFTESLEFFAAVGDRSALPLLLDDFADLAGVEGRAERQARLAAASRALQQASGFELARVAAEIEDRERADPHAFAAAWAEGLVLSEADAIAYALSDAD